MFIDDVTERVLEKMTKTALFRSAPVGSAVASALEHGHGEGSILDAISEGFADAIPGTGRIIKNMVQDPMGTLREGIHDNWNLEGQGPLSKGLFRTMAFGLPAYDAYSMATNPGGTKFEDVGRLVGNTLSTGLPFKHGIIPSILIGTLLSRGGELVGKGLDKLTGRGRAVDNRLRHQARSGYYPPMAT